MERPEDTHTRTHTHTHTHTGVRRAHKARKALSGFLCALCVALCHHRHRQRIHLPTDFSDLHEHRSAGTSRPRAWVVLGHRIIWCRHHPRLLDISRMRSRAHVVDPARSLIPTDNTLTWPSDACHCMTPGVLGIAITQSNVPANMYGFAGYYISEPCLIASHQAA